MTYSVVARDPRTGEIGVACQSHFFGVGSAVNWAEAGVGAVATQSFVNPDYGGRGLALMRDGASAEAALRTVLSADPRPDLRQVAIVDAGGSIAVHTGAACVGERGSRAGAFYSVQGNMLAGEPVLDEMAAAMEREASLTDRMLAALRAAEAAGGDLRGSQAAGILVVSAIRSDRPWAEVRLDLRVEDSAEPVTELARLVRLKRLTDVVVDVLFAEGLMLGDFVEPEPGALDRALDALAAVADEFGAANLEAALWRAVLLARAGRADEASGAMEELVGRRAQLGALLDQLRTAGFFGAGAAEQR
ncbi:DUF1028 domain-containing protein [Pseudonocardia hispaniensis]|uniref:DUF1028 domain-containing protein n=1 Tax=Pseudonocardia hispaniensis TaxID=904933 RepID=A0ABW1J1G0_9PSEU